MIGRFFFSQASGQLELNAVEGSRVSSNGALSASESRRAQGIN